MARIRGFSPTLLIIGALAAIGGSAAALLGVGVPTSSAHATAVGTALPPTLTLDIILVLPVVALIAVVAWSLISSGGTAITARGALTAIVVVAILLLGVVWILHLPPDRAYSEYGNLSGDGGTGGHAHGGTGGTGGTGGNGSNTGTGSGTSGSNGTGKNGTGSGSGNGTNGTGNGSGGKGSGNGSSGGHTNGSGSSGSGGKGGSGKSNGTAATSAVSTPPPYAAWPVYAAAVGGLLFIGALVVPELSSRWAHRRLPPDAPPPRSPVGAAAAQVFSEAAKNLAANPSDPRGVIVQLYQQLIRRLEPRVDIPTSRTPEEIRSVHLIPLGVRAEVAGHLTRLFEEACYSSHPLGSDSVRVAQTSLRIAEYDLRAAHAIG